MDSVPIPFPFLTSNADKAAAASSAVSVAADTDSSGSLPDDLVRRRRFLGEGPVCKGTIMFPQGFRTESKHCFTASAGVLSGPLPGGGGPPGAPAPAPPEPADGEDGLGAEPEGLPLLLELELPLLASLDFFAGAFLGHLCAWSVSYKV